MQSLSKRLQISRLSLTKRQFNSRTMNKWQLSRLSSRPKWKICSAKDCRNFKTCSNISTNKSFKMTILIENCWLKIQFIHKISSTTKSHLKLNLTKLRKRKCIRTPLWTATMTSSKEVMMRTSPSRRTRKNLCLISPHNSKKKPVKTKKICSE